MRKLLGIEFHRPPPFVTLRGRLIHWDDRSVYQARVGRRPQSVSKTCSRRRSAPPRMPEVRWPIEYPNFASQCRRMHFEIVGEISDIETIATGGGVRILSILRKRYRGRNWR